VPPASLATASSFSFLPQHVLQRDVALLKEEMANLNPLSLFENVPAVPEEETVVTRQVIFVAFFFFFFFFFSFFCHEFLSLITVDCCHMFFSIVISLIL
jgi:hypothetical protein